MVGYGALCDGSAIQAPIRDLKFGRPLGRGESVFVARSIHISNHSSSIKSVHNRM